MSAPEPVRFMDNGNDELEIRPGPDGSVAIIDVDPDNSDIDFHVPAHRLAEVVGAMYRAAGQEVPVLPVIRDEAVVRRLTTIISSSGASDSRDLAVYLIASGVRLPEVS